MTTEVFTCRFAHRSACVWLCVAIAVAQAGCATGLPNLRNESAAPRTAAGPARATATAGIARHDAPSGEAGGPASAVVETASASPQAPDDGSTTLAAEVAKGVVAGVLLTALIAVMFAPLILLALR